MKMDELLRKLKKINGIERKLKDMDKAFHVLSAEMNTIQLSILYLCDQLKTERVEGACEISGGDIYTTEFPAPDPEQQEISDIEVVTESRYDSTSDTHGKLAPAIVHTLRVKDKQGNVTTFSELSIAELLKKLHDVTGIEISW